MQIDNLQIPALDGYLLSALRLQPTGQIKGIIQFNSGTAIKKEFYLNFCKNMAQKGYIVILFDYRGIGGSRPKKLKGFKAYLRDWGLLDMPGILNWIAETYPEIPRYIVAHSMGSQLIGLMNNHNLVEGSYAIGLSTGYWRSMDAPFRYFCAFMWYIYMPFSSLLFGYAVGEKLRMGEDLPKGVALEWAAWCKKRTYIGTYFNKNINKNFYDEITKPFKVLVAEDDEVARPKTMNDMIKYYKNTPVDVEILRCKDYNVKSIKHFGYFSKKHSETIWNKPIDWIENLSGKKNKSDF
jgi:predicted alpha/beta hydrolase